jgi:hypothetical protein
MDNPENPAPQGTQDEEVTIKNGQSVLWIVRF